MKCLISSCPKSEHCNSESESCFEKKERVSNSYQHLQRCLVEGSESRSLEIYNATLQNKRSKNKMFGNKESIVIRSTEEEDAMYSRLN